jgi:hypothetical protein
MSKDQRGRILQKVSAKSQIANCFDTVETICRAAAELARQRLTEGSR